MERTPLAVTKNPGEIENLFLARRQQLFCSKFRGCMEINGLRLTARAQHIAAESMEMGFISRRCGQDATLDFGETLIFKIMPGGALDLAPAQ